MQINAGLNIIINASAKYRELNAVRYHAEEKMIILEFALLGVSDPQELVIKTLSDCLDTYQHLFNRESRFTKITLTESLGLTLLRITRDIDSVSEEEIGLIVNLIQAHFPNRIIETNDQEIGHEKLKKKLANKLLQSVDEKDIKAMKFSIFREEGKIVIINNREVNN